jgi:hypothetical protein
VQELVAGRIQFGGDQLSTALVLPLARSESLCCGIALALFYAEQLMVSHNSVVHPLQICAARRSQDLRAQPLDVGCLTLDGHCERSL